MNNALDINIFDTVSIEIPDPGAGNDLLFAVPIGTLIQPVAFTCAVAITGAGTERLLSVGANDSSVDFGLTSHPESMANGETHALNFSIGGQLLDNFAIDLQQFGPLTDGLLLRFGSDFVARLTNKQAGDSIFDGVLFYKQWILA